MAHAGELPCDADEMCMVCRKKPSTEVTIACATPCGGRDLTGNKRTNEEQSSDQRIEKLNEALRLSCKKGYPVRVVRSHKEKRSSYARETGVRYDGIYRIEKCWRKTGIQVRRGTLCWDSIGAKRKLISENYPKHTPETM